MFGRPNKANVFMDDFSKTPFVESVDKKNGLIKKKRERIRLREKDIN